MKSTPVGKITALFVSKKDSNREQKKYIHLDKHGIVSDKFYNKNIHRSVLITSQQSYLLAKRNHIDIPYGALGENLLIDYNPYHLPAGTQLSIGTSILEISQNCTLCDHLSKVHTLLPDLLKHDRGIFAKVICEGKISEGDTVSIL